MTESQQKQPDILIVDDVFINRMLLTDILTSLGCQCTKAHNGEEALSMLRDRTFDMILMDVEMPVMNGLETTAAIRTMEGDKSQTPIIALTAHNTDEIADELTAAGFTDMISKPFLISKIEKLVIEYCNNNQQPI
jgi:CheY-like chemotaxis protein